MKEEEGTVQIGKVTISTQEYLALKIKELTDRHEAELDKVNEVLAKVTEERGYLKFGTEEYWNGVQISIQNKAPEYISCDDVTKEFNDKVTELTKQIHDSNEEWSTKLMDKEKEIKSLQDDLLSRNTQVLRALKEDEKLTNTYKLLELLAAGDYMNHSVGSTDLRAILKLYGEDKKYKEVSTDSDYRGNLNKLQYLPSYKDDRHNNYETIDYVDFIKWILKNTPSLQLTEKDIVKEEVEIKEEEVTEIGGIKYKGLRKFFGK